MKTSTERIHHMLIYLYEVHVVGMKYLNVDLSIMLREGLLS